MTDLRDLQLAEPDPEWVATYLTEGLLQAKPYTIDRPEGITIKLDQNENVCDWPEQFKREVADRLIAWEWNRYPEPHAESLDRLIAHYVGARPDQVLSGPGSDYLLTVLLTAFSQGIRAGRGKMVVARPSFPLYETWCRNHGITYETWELDENFSYAPSLLPDLPPHSIVIFASPNNPVGNVLPRLELEKLLTAHPKSLWIADEAYFEYATEPYTRLVEKYPNLIIVRTLSKTMGAAGLRIGYLLAHQHYLEHVKKLKLPYLINHFGHVAATLLLTNPELQEHIRTSVASCNAMRAAMYRDLCAIAEQQKFHPIPSEANFFLLRWPDQTLCNDAYQALIRAGILVRNVSRGPRLAGCLRISLGTEEQNRLVLDTLLI